MHVEKKKTKKKNNHFYLKKHRQETPNCLGDRRSIFQMQTTAATEQQQTRLDIVIDAGFVLAQNAALCLPIRTSYQNLIPRHLRALQETGQAKTFYIEDLRRTSYCNFLRTSQKNFHTSTNVEHLPRSYCKDLLRRISARSPQDLLTRTCMRSCKDLLEDFTRISYWQEP